MYYKKRFCGIVQVEEVEENPVRIIPSPTCIVQLAKIRKQSNIHEGGDDSVLSTQEYMKQVVEDVGEDEDFNSGSWVGATEYVKANGGIVSGCIGDIKTFLKNGKLEQVVAIIKSCSSNALGDLKVIVKDLSAMRSGLQLFKAQYALCSILNDSLYDMITERKEGSSKNLYLKLSGRDSLYDMITERKEGSSKNLYLKLSGRDSKSEFSPAVVAMNSSNSVKISSSRRVPSTEWKILLPSSKRASKSSSKISLMTSILKQEHYLDRKAFAYKRMFQKDM
nr:hypothetical protein [Tanacetum cinerariifolium]